MHHDTTCAKVGPPIDVERNSSSKSRPTSEAAATEERVGTGGNDDALCFTLLASGATVCAYIYKILKTAEEKEKTTYEKHSSPNFLL